MPEQLTAEQGAHEPVSGRDPAGAARVTLEVLLVVVLLAAGGALCGVLWHWWWEPARGVVSDGAWYTDEAGLRREFSGTGTYVVVALAGGLVLGAVCAQLCRRSEIATLVAVALGAALAAWLMWRVGVGLGPTDPELLARTAADGTTLPDDLAVSRRSPFAAFPVGALTGLAAVYLLLLDRPHRG